MRRYAVRPAFIYVRRYRLIYTVDSTQYRVVELQDFGVLLPLCFWMSLIKLVVLYLAVLPPPLKTFTLQTLQTADELVGVASVKYLHRLLFGSLHVAFNFICPLVGHELYTARCNASS